MTFQISVMTNYRTASHFRRERSRSLSLAYINTMSEQPEVGIFNRLFNAAARARQEPTPWLLLSYSTHFFFDYGGKEKLRISGYLKRHAQ